MSSGICENLKKEKRGGSSVGYNDVMLAIKWMVGKFFEKRYYESLGKFWVEQNPDGEPLSTILLSSGGFATDANFVLPEECEHGMRLVCLIYGCERFYFSQKPRDESWDAHMFVDWSESRDGSEMPSFVVPLPGETMLKAAVLLDFCVRIRNNKTTPQQELHSILFDKTIPVGFVSMQEEYYDAWKKQGQPDVKNPLKTLERSVYNRFFNDQDYYSIPHYLLEMAQKDAGFRYLDLIKLYEALLHQESIHGERWCELGQLKNDGKMGWKAGSNAPFMVWAIGEELVCIPDTKWEDRQVPPGSCMNKQDIEKMFDTYSYADTKQMQKTIKFLRKSVKKFVDGKSHPAFEILAYRLRKLMSYLGERSPAPRKVEESSKRQRTD